MTGSTRVMSRRIFLRDLGHGAFALTLVGLTGCARAPAPTVGPSLRTAGPPTRTFDPLTYVGNLDEIEAIWCESDLPFPPPSTGPTGSPSPTATTWARIGADFASGYLLVRDGEATVVDTGPWCVPDVIEGALIAVGLDWSAVGSIIVTHKHPDHWVGLSAAIEQAPDAVVYAGAADIPNIGSPRSIVAVGADDRVTGLAIVPTPGHTPGHIAVHDEAGGVLVVGDAIMYSEPDGFQLLETSEDVPLTQASISLLAGLSFDTLLPGHGHALVGGASEALAEYVAGT